MIFYLDMLQIVNLRVGRFNERVPKGGQQQNIQN